MQECITLKDQHTSITSLHDFLIDLPKIEFHKIQEQRKEKSRYDVENIRQIMEERGLNNNNIIGRTTQQDQNYY